MFKKIKKFFNKKIRFFKKDNDKKKTKRILEQEDKVDILIPLKCGEKKESLDYFINGEAYSIPKGEVVKVPYSVAMLIMEHYKNSREDEIKIRELELKEIKKSLKREFKELHKTIDVFVQRDSVNSFGKESELKSILSDHKTVLKKISTIKEIIKKI